MSIHLLLCKLSSSISRHFLIAFAIFRPHKTCFSACNVAKFELLLFPSASSYSDQGVSTCGRQECQKISERSG